MKNFVKSIFCTLALLALIACFGHVDKRGSVTGYRNGLVTTEGGAFRVGLLPADWRRAKFNYRAILFSHKNLQASITVDSFCKGAFDDAKLSILANQLFYGMTRQHKLLQESFRLEGREALRRAVTGDVDGQGVTLDAVVLKMNECVFDFTLVANPSHYTRARGDFENFFRAFDYLRGPK